MKLKDKIILALIFVLFSVTMGTTAVRYLLDTGDIIRFDLITRYGVDDMADTGLVGDTTLIWCDFGSTANTVTEGDDARLPTTDEKAAMTGANSPSAANVFATMTDVAAGDTGVQTATGGDFLTNSGTEDNPIFDVDVDDSSEANTRLWTAEKITSELADKADVADTTLFIWKDGSQDYEANQSMGGYKITNADEPTADSDLATKQYIDDEIEALDLDLVYTKTELDYMEYADDTDVAVYISSDGLGSETLDQSNEAASTQGAFGYDAGTTYLTQSFTAAQSGLLTKFSRNFQKFNSPTGTVYAYVYSDNGSGEPDTLLATSTTELDASTISAVTPTWYEFIFYPSDATYCDSGTVYHQVIYNSQTPDATNYIHVRHSTSSAYANGKWGYGNGSSWTMSATHDEHFKEYYTSFNLLAFTESTEIEQGTYSLKIIALKDDSLADTIYHTFSPVKDLSSATSIKLDTRATRAGQNYSVKITDSGGTTTTHEVTITDTSVWQTDTWDISAVAEADKDSINQILIEIDNADTDNTFYLDNAYYYVPSAGSGTFLGLSDAPATYSGQAGKFAKVNSGETALEFAIPTEAQLALDIGTMTLWKLTQFNAFRIGNYEYMIDGFTNDFTVENEGIDETLSDTYLYDATGDYYSRGNVASPVSQWKMNDDAADTTVIDSIGSNTGEAQQNTEDINTTGKINGALTFNGTTDYVDTNLPYSSSHKTFALWAKSDISEDTSVALLGIQAPTDADRFYFGYQSDGDLRLSMGGVTDTDVYQLDTNWHHYVLINDDSNMNLYVDTELKITVAIHNPTGDYFIGAINYFGGPSWFFDGIVDDIRIYDFALDDTEIDFLYNDGNGTEESSGGNMELYSSENWTIGVVPITIRGLVLANSAPDVVKLSRTNSGVTLTDAVLNDTDSFGTYYSFEYSADVSAETSDTCVRIFISESDDTTLFIYGWSLIGLE